MSVELNHKHVSLIEVGALGKAFQMVGYCLHYPEQNVMLLRSVDVHGFAFCGFSL